MPKESDHPENLDRNLGLLSASLIVVGNIVGMGIFVSSGYVAQYAESPGLLLAAWLFGGFLSLAGSMTVAELGAAMPHAGGDYIYLRKAYGPLAGFLSGWSSFLITFSGSIAAMAVGFSEYMDMLIPRFSLKQAAIGGTTYGQLLGIFIIFIISFFNYRGVKTGGGLQNILTFIKIAAITILVFLGFWMGRGEINHFHPFWGNSSVLSPVAAFGLALIPVIFTYSGWNATTYIAGEIKDPGRNIPRSILIGILSTLMIYMLMNAVYIYAMPIPEMKGVLSIGETASTRLFGAAFSKYFSALVALSILGALSTSILIAPRIYYAMAKDGLFLDMASSVHPQHKTPAAAIVIQGIWASALVLLGGFEQLLTYVVFVIVLFSTMTVSAVFVLRKRHPDLDRPFRVPWYPFVPAAFVGCSVLIMLNTLMEKPLESALGLLIVGMGAPVYWYKKKINAKA